MTMSKIFATFIMLAGVSSSIAQTTTTATRHFRFPAVGLGSSETAEINVSNVAASATIGTAASCTGMISFTNAAGATIGTATPFTATAGQTVTARLPFAAAGATGTRTVIAGVVQQTLPTTTPRPPCSIEFSFQTFDTATGVNHVVTSAAR